MRTTSVNVHPGGEVQATPLVRNFADLSLLESAFDLTASIGRAIEQRLLEPDKGIRWLDSLRSAAQAGHFTSVIGGFITFGRKVVDTHAVCDKDCVPRCCIGLWPVSWRLGNLSTSHNLPLN